MADPPQGFFDIGMFIEDNSPQSKEVLLTYAALFSKKRITEKNAFVCIKLMSANNRMVVDTLVGNKDPLLLFSEVKPSRELLESVFTLLSSFKEDELYEKSVLACIGFLAGIYADTALGDGLYKPSKKDVAGCVKYVKHVSSKTAETIENFAGMISVNFHV